MGASVYDDPNPSPGLFRVAFYGPNDTGITTLLRTVPVKSPPGEGAPDITVSPRRDRILYEFRYQAPNRASRLERITRRVIPNFHMRPQYYDSLWVSDADGRNMRELGSQAVRSLGHDFDQRHDLIQCVKWSPDGRRISFVFGNTLYVLLLR
ncbi:MAG TPA: DPP IV N-terminal domain-containing protein [Chthonomonadaceae bacterium]|nr:DPP IV N-terminal domain-containing protein [Chthonomonadaceae bacterium]